MVKENWRDTPKRRRSWCILSGFKALFLPPRLLVGGREDGRGHGAFGGPGKRGGNKKETVGSCAVVHMRWIVRDEGEREGPLPAAPSPARGWTREWQRTWIWYLGGPEKRGGNDKEPLDLVRCGLIATDTIEQGWLCEEAEGV